MTKRKGYSIMLNFRGGWNYMGSVEVFPQMFKISDRQNIVTLWNCRNSALNLENWSLIKWGVGES